VIKKKFTLEIIIVLDKIILTRRN